MSLENNVNSYDTGKIPYKHDDKRSHWLNTGDFTLACLGHSFGVLNFYFLAASINLEGKFLLIIPFLITTLILTIPIFFVQSSIGQFSSTGYISSFRISPLFKGVGYVILLLNFTSVTYNSMMATYPLLLFFKSFTLELPWMSCNNSWNSINCTEHNNNNKTLGRYNRFLSVSPAKEYYEKEVIQISNTDDLSEISWPLVGGSFLIWLLVGLCIVNGIAVIGRILRYTTITTLIIFGILFIRISFLPNAFQYLIKFVTPSIETITHPIIWLVSPILGVCALGSGWGTVMTMASYNRFKSDVEKYSTWIPIAMSSIMFLSAIMCYFIREYMKEKNILYIFYDTDYNFEFVGVTIPYFLGTIEFSQLWSILFFLMFFLCEINSVIIQMLSIVTALFDEYVILRSFKQHIIIGMCTVLFLLSTFFTTNLSIGLFKSLTECAAVVQMMICFIELIIIVWVYGRERFQRDIQFMLGRAFVTWKFYIIRFVTPILVLFVGVISIAMTYIFLQYDTLGLILTCIVNISPWAIVPGYALYKIFVTTGSMKERFQKCVSPNDWYPADTGDRQRYDEALGSAEVSHQLVEMDIQE